MGIELVISEATSFTWLPLGCWQLQVPPPGQGWTVQRELGQGNPLSRLPSAWGRPGVAGPGEDKNRQKEGEDLVLGASASQTDMGGASGRQLPRVTQRPWEVGLLH